MTADPESIESSPGEARELVARLRASAAALRRRPVADLVRVLGGVGARFLDSSDPISEEALDALPDDAGLSGAMARAVLPRIAREWTTERLDGLVRADFADPRVLDGFRPAPGGGLHRAVGPSFSFHIGAGSVPGVGATSLLRALLVKSPVLLKPGRGDEVLSRLVARAVAEADPSLASSLAVRSWPGGEGGALEEVALAEAEQVVVYGGASTIASIRGRIRPETRLVAYGHRVSMAAVGRDALGSRPDADTAAADTAMAAALFDQRGCVSPQVVWVELGGGVTPREWASLLADHLDRLEGEIPPGPPDPADRSRIHQLRGASELMRATGASTDVLARDGGSWTVIFEGGAGAPTCAGRTVHVRSIADLGDLGPALAPFRDVLQTFGVAGESTRERVAEVLAVSGVTRITDLRGQPWPPPEWRHDGQGPLLALIRWVGVDG